MTSRMTSSPLTEASSTSPRSRTKSRSFTRLSGRSLKNVIQQAADRGAFIDQSQSLNIHIAEPNFGKMSSMHFFGWESGLKTGMYYLRTKPAAQAIQFTVDKSKVKDSLSAKKEKAAMDLAPAAASDLSAVTKNMETLVCSIQNRDECLSCGS